MIFALNVEKKIFTTNVIHSLFLRLMFVWRQKLTNCAWDIYSDILFGNQYGPIFFQNQEKCPLKRYFLLIKPSLNVQESRIVPCVRKNDNHPLHKDCCDRTCRRQHSVTAKDAKFFREPLTLHEIQLSFPPSNGLIL